MRRVLKSLSARLLVLTVFFVMLSEVLIFVPSVARFRMDYLDDRLAAGHLATMAIEASGHQKLPPGLTRQLLAEVRAHAVLLHRGDGVVEMLDSPQPPPPQWTVDLTHPTIIGAIMGSIRTLFSHGNPTFRVIGPAPMERNAKIELLLDQRPLRVAMWDFGKRIFELSVVISIITAALVFVSLHWLLVRPMRRITESMTLFREDPEDASRRIVAGRRGDEIGRAERELAILQETVRQALGQRARLAALGTAVGKINHDLRNILTTARLVSEGLSASAAPEVRRLAPRLVEAIDRAIALCTQTLDFSREGAPPFAPSRFALAGLVEEVAASLAAPGNGPAITSAIPKDLVVEADRDQLHRVLLNLAKNAVDAGAHELTFSSSREGTAIAIDLADDGPGLPPRARDNLFRPFFGSARPGGSGLGLAIARELMRVHGGDLVLLDSSAAGTVFRLSLPASAEVSRAPTSRS
jgi:signal transduction histidine kinase